MGGWGYSIGTGMGDGSGGGYVLDSDFATGSATAVPITNLGFTPLPNTHYEFEVLLRTRTALATVGPRPGISWPTGLVDGVARIVQTSAAGTEVLQNGNHNAAIMAPVGGLPNTTQSWPAMIRGSFTTGPSPSGSLQVTLASETAATNVTAKAGSSIRFRTIGGV